MQKIDLLIKIIDSDSLITSEQAVNFLNDHSTRNYFINYYNYFSEIDKKKIVNFIEKSFNEKISNDLKIDLLELCALIGYFNETIFNLVKGYLVDKTNYLMKLASLDYLNTFYYLISKDEYIYLNRSLEGVTNNNLVKFQTFINLMLYDHNKYYHKVIKKLKSNNLPPYFYYRFANSLSYSQFSELDIKNVFLNIIENQLLRKDLKDELRTLINSL